MSKFAELKSKLISEGKSADQAGGLAYTIGKRKYGKAGMRRKAIAGEKKELSLSNHLKIGAKGSLRADNKMVESVHHASRYKGGSAFKHMDTRIGRRSVQSGLHHKLALIKGAKTAAITGGALLASGAAAYGVHKLRKLRNRSKKLSLAMYSDSVCPAGTPAAQTMVGQPKVRFNPNLSKRRLKSIKQATKGVDWSKGETTRQAMSRKGNPMAAKKYENDGTDLGHFLNSRHKSPHPFKGKATALSLSLKEIFCGGQTLSLGLISNTGGLVAPKKAQTTGFRARAVHSAFAGATGSMAGAMHDRGLHEGMKANSKGLKKLAHYGAAAAGSSVSATGPIGGILALRRIRKNNAAGMYKKPTALSLSADQKFEQFANSVLVKDAESRSKRN